MERSPELLGEIGIGDGVRRGEVHRTRDRVGIDEMQDRVEVVVLSLILGRPVPKTSSQRNIRPCFFQLKSTRL